MELFIYMVVSVEEEKSICSLEARILLEADVVWFGQTGFVVSKLNINFHRSSYIKWKLTVLHHALNENQLIALLSTIKPKLTYRMNWLDGYSDLQLKQYGKRERRTLEAKYGVYIDGKVQLVEAGIQYGICQINSDYYVGLYEESDHSWQQHHYKPAQYSVALSTRLARTLINIAIPRPHSELTFVDPCCGIGTVLLEAAALSVKAEGYDLNPIILKGTRENLAYYNYDVKVIYKDMLTLTDQYDAALLDLPYNICSVLPEADKIKMIEKLHTIATRYVIVSVEPLTEILKQLNIPVIDYGVHYKGKFKREVFLCGK